MPVTPILEINNRSSDLKPNSVSAKLLREVEVLGLGSLSGIGSAAVSHPLENAAKLTASTGFGFLVTAATDCALLPKAKLAKQVALLAGTIAFGLDVAPRISTVAQVIHRTWDSDESLVEDKSVIGETIGKFLFDSALMSTGGIYGTKLAKFNRFEGGAMLPVGREVAIPTFSSAFNQDPRFYRLYNGNDKLANIYGKSQSSVAYIEVGTAVKGEKVTHGTAFVVRKDGLLATAAHVADNPGEKLVQFQNGKAFIADIVYSNSKKDVALLQLRAPAGESFSPVQLGSSKALSDNEKLVAIGHPRRWQSLYASTGRTTDLKLSETYASSTRTYSTKNQIQVEMAGAGGLSGSPVFDVGGKVVGIFTAGHNASFGSAARIEHISKMLASGRIGRHQLRT
jgi:S1-C subfamily serine protease